ncbi:MAG: nitroreductase family protein [Planctomycetota bacterium]|jgi:nitroreductase/NAD-dependent dihydropyrimidine dehydrogenase PreA subunit|nr:nitroreductase family protein [Planctomycetota bacterium]
MTESDNDACRFTVDPEKCVGCGECAADCIAEIIDLQDSKPEIAPDQRANGIGCQHCLTICPTGAVSVLGLNPADSLPLDQPEFFPTALDILMRGRRSIRRFRQEQVPEKLIRELLGAIAHAPTGVNAMRRRFTVIASPVAMDSFRKTTMAAILDAEKRGDIPEYWDWLPDSAREWQNGGKDEVFRGAPHLLVVSSHKDSPCPQPDAFIAMSYFDLLAQSRGVGTVWGGIPYALIGMIAPELRQPLGIPEDHVFVYAMMFGFPEVRHWRSAQRLPEDIHWIIR